MSGHVAMSEPARTIAFIGATSGLGRAAADQLSKDGHRLVLVGRDPKRVEQLAKQLPTAVVIGADISTTAGIDQAVTQIESAVNHLDALVNNAGVMIPARQMSISARKGAEPVALLATKPVVERGAYYNRFTTTRSSPESHDNDIARSLWEVTEALRGPFGQ